MHVYSRLTAARDCWMLVQSLFEESAAGLVCLAILDVRPVLRSQIGWQVSRKLAGNPDAVQVLQVQ